MPLAIRLLNRRTIRSRSPHRVGKGSTTWISAPRARSSSPRSALTRSSTPSSLTWPNSPVTFPARERSRTSVISALDRGVARSEEFRKIDGEGGLAVVGQQKLIGLANQLVARVAERGQQRVVALDEPAERVEAEIHGRRILVQVTVAVFQLLKFAI